MHAGAGPLPEHAGGLDSPEQLAGCLRDMLSLLALPALLSGKPPRQLIEILAESLEHLFQLDACCIRAPFGRDALVLEAFRVQGERLNDPGEGWSPLREPPDAGLAAESAVGWIGTPLGELRVVRVTMNYAGHAGVMMLASRDPAFPDPRTAVSIRAAASLAGNALTTADALYEREVAARAKDEFLAMLGHELRNPLAPITSVMAILKIRGGGRLSREHQIIERQVRHLTGLVDDLLDVARVARGKIDLVLTELETSAVVAQAVETARPLIEQRRHEVTITVPVAGLPIRCDQRRMAQVISNLLINAAKYTPEDGRIDVWAREDAGEVLIGVRDTGVGIDPQRLPRLFDMFYQVEGSHDRSGLGLGLALVRSLVELHGGRVSASSAGPDAGSEFVVALPLLTGAAPAASPAYKPPLPGASRRVLVVDDNVDAAATLGQLLELTGHETRLAHDAASALLVCESFHPSVAILDIGLPGVDGYQLAQLLRKRMGADCPRLIALSGYGLASDVERSRAAGFQAHMAKPMEPGRLLSMIANTEEISGLTVRSGGPVASPSAWIAR